MIGATIVAIAKLEKPYIEEWVKYHLSLGFLYIVLYDNEDVPTYKNMLKKYSNRVIVIHYPGRGKQYAALNHFVNNFIRVPSITHVIHMDIDEFIVLKKHTHINDFIKSYIKGNCAGIGINWKFFGSSNQTKYTNKPVTFRFTKCQKGMNNHVKTLFDKKKMSGYYTNVHYIKTIPNYYIKSTKGNNIVGPFNSNHDDSVIQLNHYKTKTLEEFKKARTRGRADFAHMVKEDINKSFKQFNRNEVTDLTAFNTYKKFINL
jgi:hypothetical protein